MSQSPRPRPATAIAARALSLLAAAAVALLVASPSTAPAQTIGDRFVDLDSVGSRAPDIGTSHTERVFVSEFDGSNFNSVPGVVLRYAITGVNPSSGVLPATDSGGETSITWTGTNPGRDDIGVWQDSDNDGALDANEPSDAATITWRVVLRPSPITEIFTGPDLSCQAEYAGDGDPAFDPNFFDLEGVSESFATPGSGDCGTFVSIDGELYGPDQNFGVAPGASFNVSVEEYTPVSQTTPTGSGTRADPFRVTTVVCAGNSTDCGPGGRDPLIRHEVTYVNGDQFYRADVTVINRHDVAHSVGIYQYGDCLLPDPDDPGDSDDFGFGFFDASTSGIYCAITVNNNPPGRVLGFVPADSGSSYIEDDAFDTLEEIEEAAADTPNSPDRNGPLPNFCEGCSLGVDEGDHDHAVALGWGPLELPAGGQVRRGFLTAFVPSRVPDPVTPPDPPPPVPPIVQIINNIVTLGGPDRDSDGVVDASDNCLDTPNADQADVDRDGIGDACDDNDASAGPTNGATIVAQVVSGTVFFRLPPTGGPRSGARSSQAARRSRPLKGAALLPVGTVLDTTTGRVRVSSHQTTTGGRKNTQRSDFYAGIFQVRQRRARNALADITLRSPSAAVYDRVCGTAASASRAGGGTTATAAQRRSSRVVSRLWGDGRGRFRTRGRHSAATVRGTIWLTQNRCDGTRTSVTRGSVRVRDLRANRTVTVRAGGSYLARALRAAVRRRR